jgi:hypothetical protein
MRDAARGVSDQAAREGSHRNFNAGWDDSTRHSGLQIYQLQASSLRLLNST